MCSRGHTTGQQTSAHYHSVSNAEFPQRSNDQLEWIPVRSHTEHLHRGGQCWLHQTLWRPSKHWRHQIFQVSSKVSTCICAAAGGADSKERSRSSPVYRKDEVLLFSEGPTCARPKVVGAGGRRRERLLRRLDGDAENAVRPDQRPRLRRRQIVLWARKDGSQRQCRVCVSWWDRQVSQKFPGCGAARSARAGRLHAHPVILSRRSVSRGRPRRLCNFNAHLAYVHAVRVGGNRNVHSVVDDGHPARLPARLHQLARLQGSDIDPADQ